MKIISFSNIILFLSPTFSLAQSPNAIAARTFSEAGVVITGLVKNNSRLTPEFLRLGFHDCVGGCDGCIDMSDSGNNGLAHPIAVLAPVVAQFANSTTGVSRADIWALAAMVGASVAKYGGAKVNFTQNWYGRVNCEDANSVCKDAAGAAVPCSATAGPFRSLPPPTLDTNGVFSYFADNFGFTERQTIAIMGAHSVGQAVTADSGIDGPHGWTANNTSFQNEYYQALIGTVSGTIPSANASESSVVQNSLNWAKFFKNNSGTGAPDRNYWKLTIAGANLIMLDSDIALVRNLNSTNTNPNSGAVTCDFKGSNACPLSSTWQVAASFAGDNTLWLGEFRSAYDLMLTNGYGRAKCQDAVCPLTNTRIGSTQKPSNTPTVNPQPTTAAPTTMPVNFLYTPQPATAAPTSAPVQFLYTPQPATGSPTAMPIQFLYTPQPVTAAPTSAPVQFLYTPSPVQPVASIQPTPNINIATPPPSAPRTPRPTFAPTPPPTAPIGPKSSPTLVPTRPPTLQPTSASVATGGCCTQNFATCVNYCGTTLQQCNTCSDTTVAWLPKGIPPANTCISRWNACTNNVAGCCPGLVCVGDQWWKGCQYVSAP